MGQAPVTPGASGAGQAVPLPQRAPRSRRRRSGPNPSPGLSQGEVVLARSERLQDVKDTGVGLALHASSLPWLANLAKAFDLYRWLSATLEYRPLVGTTTAGAVALGFDWSAKTAQVKEDGRLYMVGAPTRDNVLACTPCYDGPVWQRGVRLVLPSDKLQQKRWYDASKADVETHPGYVTVISTGTTKDAVVGEVWLHYRVCLAGTRTV